MSSTDETIKCVDCGADFQFSQKDAAFYAEQQFQKPKRCHDCRKKKKAKFAAKEAAKQPVHDDPLENL